MATFPPLGDGESGWSKTGTGVLDGVERTDGLGDVRSDASPIANFALSLSSSVTRDREAEGGMVALGDDGSGCGLFGVGLPALCVARDLRRLVTAVSLSCPVNESDWRSGASVVGLDGSPAEPAIGVPSWDSRGACCARFSMVCRH